MKIKEVSFSETFPMNNGHFQKIFVTAEIEGDDDPKKALYEAKKLVNNFFYESNKAEEKKKEEPINKESGFIEAINSCTSKKSLEVFRKLVERENIPELTTAFENKLKSFQ